jgi:hypothetical protein
VLPGEARAQPTASLFGERGGRALIAVSPDTVAEMRRTADVRGVPAVRLGVAGGDALDLAAGELPLSVTLVELEGAWTTPF